MEVELIDKLGTDLNVVNAARISFSKRKTELDEKDTKLINYLAKHNHWTPFGHCQVTFRVKAPIFVARQLVKHQVGLVWNEVSRRYVDSKPEFYQHEIYRKKADNKKQGSLDEPVEFNNIAIAEVHMHNKASIELYDYLLSIGVCPEQARCVLPLDCYTEWYWTGSLAAWARVCKLRLDPHTQQETQEVAQMLSDILEKEYPVSWKALMLS